jgi:hypothetical protein
MQLAKSMQKNNESVLCRHRTAALVAEIMQLPPAFTRLAKHENGKKPEFSTSSPGLYFKLPPFVQIGSSMQDSCLTDLLTV